MTDCYATARSGRQQTGVTAMPCRFDLAVSMARSASKKQQKHAGPMPDWPSLYASGDRQQRAGRDARATSSSQWAVPLGRAADWACLTESVLPGSGHMAAGSK